MCLVINKMDRLIHEVKLTPDEAHTRMRGIITHVNMILSAFQSEQHISDADAVLAHEDAKATVDSRCGASDPQFMLFLVLFPTAILAGWLLQISSHGYCSPEGSVGNKPLKYMLPLEDVHSPSNTVNVTSLWQG